MSVLLASRRVLSSCLDNESQVAVCHSGIETQPAALENKTCATMFEPVRGGTRGGQAEFKWSDVSADKDRENYLGHSVNAPTGRWQKNKDVHWYNRDVSQGAVERAEEIRKIKEAEADALAVALGFAPAPKTAPQTSPPAATPNTTKPIADGPDAERAAQKDERRRRKAERREERRARREKRRAGVAGRASEDGGERRRIMGGSSGSRSRSPVRRQSRERGDSRRVRSRSRTPLRERGAREGEYGVGEREREREAGRRRWDVNARREEPGARWGRR